MNQEEILNAETNVEFSGSDSGKGYLQAAVDTAYGNLFLADAEICLSHYANFIAFPIREEHFIVANSQMFISDFAKDTSKIGSYGKVAAIFQIFYR